jgi:hypothetical protein
MKYTRLEDFTEDQLRLMLRMATAYRGESEMKLSGMKRFESIGILLTENIDEEEQLLKEIDIIQTQIAGALYQIEKERKVASN